MFSIEFPDILDGFQTPQTVSRPSRPNFQTHNEYSLRQPQFWVESKLFLVRPLEMKLFCRYIGGLSAGHVSYSLGRLKYIAIYRIHSAGSNIYRNISDAIDFKSNNNFHRSKLSIIFHFYFLLANQLEPPNNISQVIINQPLSCEHPWRKKSFVEPKAVLGSVKSSSWKFFNFRVSGENRRNIHFNKALRHSNEH